MEESGDYSWSLDGRGSEIEKKREVNVPATRELSDMQPTLLFIPAGSLQLLSRSCFYSFAAGHTAIFPLPSPRDVCLHLRSAQEARSCTVLYLTIQ
jgi:hypothetical protein